MCPPVPYLVGEFPPQSRSLDLSILAGARKVKFGLSGPSVPLSHAHRTFALVAVCSVLPRMVPLAAALSSDLWTRRRRRILVSPSSLVWCPFAVALCSEAVAVGVYSWVSTSELPLKGYRVPVGVRVRLVAVGWSR